MRCERPDPLARDSPWAAPAACGGLLKAHATAQHIAMQSDIKAKIVNRVSATNANAVWAGALLTSAAMRFSPEESATLWLLPARSAILARMLRVGLSPGRPSGLPPNGHRRIAKDRTHLGRRLSCKPTSPQVMLGAHLHGRPSPRPVSAWSFRK
jgi:hypothetical protein